jgi:putative membrane protein
MIQEGKPLKHLMLIAALCLPIAAAASDDNPDAHFYKKAAQTGLAEIDGGMLAQQLGKDKAVTNFGNMMVKDHSAANSKLRELAVIHHIDLPMQPDANHVAQRSKLRTLSGDEFDKSYIEWQILSHRDAIALFKEESASGDDLDARRFATDSLPTLELHLAALMAIPVTPSTTRSP